MGGAPHLIAPIKILQNGVSRLILGKEKITSETEVYPEMNALKIENSYKLTLLLFVFKNKVYFQVHDSISYSRTEGGLVALYPI